MLEQYKAMLPAFSVPTGWTGSVEGCVPGDTSAAHKQATLSTLNYYRNLVKLPPVVLVDTYAAINREAALMQRAQNKLSHTPLPDWKCYTAAAADGAGSSIIALNLAGPWAMLGYMQDVEKPELGHRRFMLNSKMLETSTGDTINTNAMWIYGREAAVSPPNIVANGIPWPPSGFVPWSSYVVLPTDHWSFSLPDGDFSAATVSLRNDKGQALAVAQGVLPNGIADNGIRWNLKSPDTDWSRAPADSKISVSIANVKVNGKLKTFTYDVIWTTP